MDWPLAMGFFAALIAILNPLGNLPVFVGVTSAMRGGVRRGLAVLMAVFVVVALTVFLFGGQAILGFFGISIPAFEVAGGILLLLMGLNMVRGSSHDVAAVESAKTDQGAFREAEARFGEVLVPVGIPLFVGPGSISTVILFAARTSAHGEAIQWPVMVGVIVACAALMLAVLLGADLIAKLLGETGLAIVTRIMGLIICAMAVQFMLDGLATVMPTLFDAKAMSS